jgi:tRNA pseudouridine38-40 synthase
MSVGSSVKNTERTVYSCEVFNNNEEITIRISADGFLYNMVRIICGTLLEIGKGSVAPEQIPDIILSKNRQNAGPTLPACGLYLVGVNYPD